MVALFLSFVSTRSIIQVTERRDSLFPKTRGLHKPNKPFSSYFCHFTFGRLERTEKHVEEKSEEWSTTGSWSFHDNIYNLNSV